MCGVWEPPRLFLCISSPAPRFGISAFGLSGKEGDLRTASYAGMAKGRARAGRRTAAQSRMGKAAKACKGRKSAGFRACVRRHIKTGHV